VSTTDYPTAEPTAQAESRASFKLTRNAKGDTQIEVKTYALDDTAEGEEAALLRATSHYDMLRRQYPS